MNILIIAPFFFPDRGVGALRMSSLARYLLQNEVEISVITNRKKELSTGISANYFYVDSLQQGNFVHQFNVNCNKYMEAFEYMCKQSSYDAVIISGGPFYTFPVAKVAKKYRIPCYLDFRDPWVFDFREPLKFFNFKNLIREAYYLPKERGAVKSATAVVTVTPKWINNFKRYYPVCREKFVLIENGYDDEQLSNIRLIEKKKASSIVLGVFGKLFYYTEKYSNIFAAALKEFQQDISVLQVGERESQVDAILRSNGVTGSVIESTGFLSYNIGIATLMNADVFVIIDVRKGAIGTKIYDYIYLGKPILYVGPKNTAISGMIVKYKLGYVCSTTDEIKNVFRIIKTGTYKFRQDANLKHQFSRREQNRKWLELLNESR